MAQRQDFRRIGLLLPSSSSVQERDFCRVLPEDITLHVARMRLSNVEAESRFCTSSHLSRSLDCATAKAVRLPQP
jgi:maleate cis-trans isomerase